MTGRHDSFKKQNKTKKQNKKKTFFLYISGFLNDVVLHNPKIAKKVFQQVRYLSTPYIDQGSQTYNRPTAKTKYHDHGLKTRGTIFIQQSTHYLNNVHPAMLNIENLKTANKGEGCCCCFFLFVCLFFLTEYPQFEPCTRKRKNNRSASLMHHKTHTSIVSM